MKKDSVICRGCNREFALGLVEMVRRRPMWCDTCVAERGEALQGAAERGPVPEATGGGLRPAKGRD